MHGFLRAADGTITTFDVPGAAFGTILSAINPADKIVGYYFDADFIGHSFLRAPDGTFTTFEVPGAAVTQAVGINPSGTTTGMYCDAEFVACHSFVRAADAFAAFDPAMSPNLSGVINPAGAVTGTYSDAGLFHGFVRAANGTVTTFDAPDVCGTMNGTVPLGINPAGLVVGTYWDAGCAHSHGFVRTLQGTFTTIDVPNAVDTEVHAINPAGAISGACIH